MKYIELALRRNKISQRWHQRPSHSWGRGAHNGYEGLPSGVRDVQVAGRNIGNILFFQDYGIKYLPRRNKSYVAVRSHLGGNRWIPESQRYCRSFRAPSGEKQYTEETSDIDVFSAIPWRLLGVIISMSESWDRMCTVRVIYDGNVVAARCTLLQLFGQ